MGQMLKRHSVSLCVVMAILAISRAIGQEPLFNAVTDAEAWARLPDLKVGVAEPLPVWARILVRSLPATTASMLEMDRVQRAEASLNPKLRARIRWEAARANGCAYSEANAVADYVSAGGVKSDLSNEAVHSLTEIDRRTMEFAHRMCREAYSVTDADVAQLLEHYGPERLTGIVLCLAYANFQDRMFNALGITVEPGGPLPPPKFVFDWDKPKELSEEARQDNELFRRTSTDRKTCQRKWTIRSGARHGIVLR
jgi:hypothetical protein